MSMVSWLAARVDHRPLRLAARSMMALICTSSFLQAAPCRW